MKNFDDIEALVEHMLEEIKIDFPVSIIAHKNIAVEVLGELFTYNRMVLDFAVVNSDCVSDCDDEYMLTLRYDTDTDTYCISIHPAINASSKKYLSTDGYVLFHEDVNSKAQIDMENNKFASPEKHDWFTIDGIDIEDEISETEDSKKSVITSSAEKSYKINGKPVTRQEFNKFAEDFEKDFYKSLYKLAKITEKINSIMIP